MLRDHSRPCEHGYSSQHPTPKGEGPSHLSDGFAYDLCPGGAPVAIDYEAALNAWQHSEGDDDEAVIAAVNAALGIVEVDDDH